MVRVESVGQRREVEAGEGAAGFAPLALSVGDEGARAALSQPQRLLESSRVRGDAAVLRGDGARWLGKVGPMIEEKKWSSRVKRRA